MCIRDRGVDMKKLIHNLATEQGKNTELGRIIIAVNQIPNIPFKWEKHFSLYNKHLFHQTNGQSDDWKVCLPKVIIPEVVKDCHLGYGHIAVSYTHLDVYKRQN